MGKVRRREGAQGKQFNKLIYTLVIREHRSGSVVSDMALYYAQYKHTKFG